MEIIVSVAFRFSVSIHISNSGLLLDVMCHVCIRSFVMFASVASL